MRGRSGSFSVGRLMEFLTALGQDVEITVRPTLKQHGEMSVTLGRVGVAQHGICRPIRSSTFGFAPKGGHLWRMLVLTTRRGNQEISFPS
jgi:hypothetical protein